MTVKRFVTLLLLVGVLITSIAPAFAQEDFDITPYMEAYFASLADFGYGHVGPSDVAVSLLENPDLFLLDVRGPSELAEVGFIEGAVNVPVREMAQHVDQLPADLDTPIAVYCAKGTRGLIAAAALRVMGYTDVVNMAGGFGAWVEEGNAIVTDEYVAPEAAGGYMFEDGLVAFMDAYLTDGLPQGWGQISADDYAVQVLETMPFQLDVRTQGELESDGYIPGTTLIPVNDLFANIDQIPADMPVFVNCKSGWRGTLAMVPLQMLGYEAVNLAGGQNGYVAAGYEVEGKPEAAAEAFSIDPYMEGYFANLAEMGYGHVGPSDVAISLVENPDLFLLDVRNPEELAEVGFIEGAVNAPVRAMAQYIDQLPADLDTPIAVYCAKGTRGLIAAATLRVMGYTDVVNMAGGFGAWVEEGNAIVTEEYVAPEAAGGYMFDPELVAFMDDYLMNVLPQGWGQMSAEDYAVQVLEVMPFQLDVRTQGEKDSDGAIPGTTLIPINDLYANIDQVPAGDVYVNCKSGWRGTLAMVPLQMMGYDAINLAGGQNAWVAAGYDVEGGAPVEAVEVVLPEGEALAAETVAPVVFESVQNIASLAGFGTLAEADFVAAMEGAFILDVREVAEYAEGFIPGAVNVPLREVPANLNVLPDFDAPILVYCKAGYRGAVAALALDALGYENVYNLRGGIGAWTGELSSDAPMVASAAFPAVEADLWVAMNDYYTNLPAGWAIVGPDDFALEMTESEIFIVDVREASEYDAGHIAGAVNWPTRAFGMYLEEAPEDMGADIVVYGSGGHRTALAQHALSLAGYESVRGMAAGSAGWANAGYELVTE